MFIKGALVTNASPEFHVIRIIPIFLPIPPLLFNHLHIISGLNLPLSRDCTYHLVASFYIPLLMMSQGYIVPPWIYLLATYLDPLQW